MTSTTERALKIAKLLTQAEATTYPAEAETFLAHATELMERWRIDDAMVVAARRADDAPEDPVEEVRISLGAGHYVNLRTRLLEAIGSHYGCKVLHAARYSGRTGYIIGHRSDIERTVSLYGALSVHAARAMLVDSPHGNRGETIRWRRNFLYGYRSEVQLRLERIAKAALDTSEYDAGTVALALRERSKDADDWVRSTYPKVGKARPSHLSYDPEGFRSGRSAGEKAPIDVGIETTPVKELV